jgi:hypothetical protein
MAIVPFASRQARRRQSRQVKSVVVMVVVLVVWRAENPNHLMTSPLWSLHRAKPITCSH